MKQIKQQWEEELDKVVPNLRQDVQNEPIPAQPTKTYWWQAFANFVFSNKRPFAVATSFCLVFIIAVVALLPAINTPQQAFATTVMVEVNPSATFAVDKDGIVTNVVANNGDADVLLSNANVAQQLKGVPVEQSVQTFVDYCAQLGYLNLAQQSAVRVSTCENGNHAVLDKVSERMETYFQQKGAFVAVVAQSLNLQQFAERAGMEATKNLNQLVEKVQNLATTYGSRVQELQDLYQQVVSFNDVSTVILDAVHNKSEEVDLRLQQLEAMETLSQSILEHPDNQFFLVLSLDYWTIVNGNLDVAEGEFALLIEQMTQALQTYQQTFNDQVISRHGLEHKINVYQMLQTSLDVTLEFVQENLEFIQSLFPSDEAMAKLFDLFKIPQTHVQYLEKLANYCQSRLEMYQQQYGQQQQQLTAQQYQNHIEQLQSQHGSMENYWNSLQN